ncbi:MAG: hypothetical protein QOH69_3186 [Actinomycetota bacterium]|jgi:hypothetical protein|nr:hypothetical protein [Actinomycetota bacterium]
MSSPNSGPGRVVAELGRPETPEETAARKAENSRAHRANQTTRNLILALLASLAIVLFTVLVVVRPGTNLVTPVNYRSVAAQAQKDVSETLASPALPSGWHSNDAELKTDSGKTVTWYVGLITPKQQFIALEQGIHTSDTWFGSLLGKAQATGHVTIDGVRWTVYDQRGASGVGNFPYALAATIDGSQLVLHGSASNAEFRVLASAVATSVSNGTGN